MAITSNAAITMSALRAEFKGGSAAVSMSQLNRGGGYVPVGGARNASIPASDVNLSFSKYRNSSKTVVVYYDVIGGGGTGGFGQDDEGESFRGTYGGSGGSSYLYRSGSKIVTGNGGAGGQNCGGGRGTSNNHGQASAFGAGGRGGGRNNWATITSSTHYGAGGGGGGGDKGTLFDSGGCSGLGGKAGTRRTGSITVNYDEVFTLKSGGRGSYNYGGDYRGSQGAGGRVAISWDAKSSTTTGTKTATIN